MDILYRLINGDKVVGFEKHHVGSFLVTITHSRHINKDGRSIIGFPDDYISHDRKDLFTGIEIDGEKVFENDRVSFYFEDSISKVRYDRVGIVSYELGRFEIQRESCRREHYSLIAPVIGNRIKITGILGVTP